MVVCRGGGTHECKVCGEEDTGVRVVGLTNARCAGRRRTLGLGWWDSRMQGVRGGGHWG